MSVINHNTKNITYPGSGFNVRLTRSCKSSVSIACQSNLRLYASTVSSDVYLQIRDIDQIVTGIAQSVSQNMLFSAYCNPEEKMGE